MKPNNTGILKKNSRTKLNRVLDVDYVSILYFLDGEFYIKFVQTYIENDFYCDE